MAQDGRMRVPRLLLAVALGAVGALTGTLIGTGPAAAAGTATLALRPDHGRPTTPFAVEYQFSPQNLTCPAAVSFTWDGQPLGTAHVVRSRQVCVAALGTAPPADDNQPGRHTVGVDPVAGHQAKVATYTVQPGSTATPTRTPTPGGTTAGPTEDPLANGVNTSPASLAPLDTNGASVMGEASKPSGGGGAMAAILIFGGLLMLGGIAIFGLLIYWTRRGGGGGVEPDTEVYGAYPVDHGDGQGPDAQYGRHAQ
jgi:hypothetical protein